MCDASTTSDGPRFYLGTHQPGWLARRPEPLFISDRRLRTYRRLPVAVGTWALDSGGFTELAAHGSWERGPTPAEYVARIRRYAAEVGGLLWAAPQDWMCEPWMTAKTGLTVAEHQRRTIDNFTQLRDLAPDLPIVPVVQGWTVADYLLRTNEDHEFLVRWPQTVAERALGRPVVGFCPAAHVLFDHCPHLAAEFRVGHVPHAFGLEHRIGEAVHVARRRLLEPTVFRRRQAEAELDAQFVKEESNLELQVIRLVHGDIMPVDALILTA